MYLLHLYTIHAHSKIHPTKAAAAAVAEAGNDWMTHNYTINRAA